MSEREEYAVIDENPDGLAGDLYAAGLTRVWPKMTAEDAHAEFYAWLAAHDRKVREQVAQEIEVEMRRHDRAQVGFSAVGDAYAHAARIARGEDQTDE